MSKFVVQNEKVRSLLVPTTRSTSSPKPPAPALPSRSKCHPLESIVHPDDYAVDSYATSCHKMPSFAHVSEDDRADLVYMLRFQTTDELFAFGHRRG